MSESPGNDRRPPVYFVGPEPVYNWKPKPLDPEDKKQFYHGDWRKAWPKEFKTSTSTLAKAEAQNVSSIQSWVEGD